MKVLQFLESSYPGLADPWAAFLISFITGVTALFILRGIANGLLEMHRSKTALRKLRKEYTLRDRFLMLPPWNRCEHAPKFCRALVCIHHFRLCLLVISFLLCLFGIGIESLHTVSVLLCLAPIILIDIPTWILFALLDHRTSWRSNRHEYRFKKYEHTSERRKLW